MYYSILNRHQEWGQCLHNLGISNIIGNIYPKIEIILCRKSNLEKQLREVRKEYKNL